MARQRGGLGTPESPHSAAFERFSKGDTVIVNKKLPLLRGGGGGGGGSDIVLQPILDSSGKPFTSPIGSPAAEKQIAEANKRSLEKAQQLREVSQRREEKERLQT